MLKGKLNRLYLLLNLRGALILFIFFLLNRCTTEVEFGIETVEDQYVVNCLMSPEHEMKVYLSKTTDITDSTIYSLVRGTITLFENGVQIPVSIDTGTVSYGLNFKPSILKRYRIEIQMPDKIETLQAEDSVPSYVYLEDATYRYPAYTGQYQTTYGDLEITFSDEKNTANYYEILLLRDTKLLQTFNVKSPVITMDTERDPVMLPSILFSDEKFRDSTLVMHVFTDGTKNPTVILRNVSLNYYQYKKTLYQHLNNQNIERENIYDIFKGDPFDLYTNVSFGLGIFAAYSESSLLSRTINK